jgi:transcriptional regulator with XRE-family HTH domain
MSLQDGTDNAILKTLGERLAARRLSLNRTQVDVATEAGVSLRTLVRLEAGESTQLTNLIRILRVLDVLKGLDLLLPPEAPGPLEILRHRRKRRRRACGTTQESERSAEGAPWTWDDEDAPPKDER